MSALTAGAGALTLNVLNNSHAKFGDMSQMLRADIMTGAAWHKLVDKALTMKTQYDVDMLFSDVELPVR